MKQYFVTNFVNDNVVKCFVSGEKDAMRIFNSVISSFGVVAKKIPFALYCIDEKTCDCSFKFLCYG